MIFVYTGKDGSFNLYEDEGENYNYEKGEFSTIPMSYSEANKTLTIGERKGSYKNMPETRSIKIYFIDKEQAKPFDLNQKADAEIQYNGTTQNVTK